MVVNNNTPLSLLKKIIVSNLFQCAARKEKYHAIDTIGYRFGCRWGGPVGDQQLHTDAIYHKENLECGSDYISDCLAVECLRFDRKPHSDSYWEVKSLKLLSMPEGFTTPEGLLD